VGRVFAGSPWCEKSDPARKSAKRPKGGALWSFVRRQRWEAGCGEDREWMELEDDEPVLRRKIRRCHHRGQFGLTNTRARMEEMYGIEAGTAGTNPCDREKHLRGSGSPCRSPPWRPADCQMAGRLQMNGQSVDSGRRTIGQGAGVEVFGLREHPDSRLMGVRPMGRRFILRSALR